MSDQKTFPQRLFQRLNATSADPQVAWRQRLLTGMLLLAAVFALASALVAYFFIPSGQAPLSPSQLALAAVPFLLLSLGLNLRGSYHPAAVLTVLVFLAVSIGLGLQDGDLVLVLVGGGLSLAALSATILLGSISGYLIALFGFLVFFLVQAFGLVGGELQFRNAGAVEWLQAAGLCLALAAVVAISSFCVRTLVAALAGEKALSLQINTVQAGVERQMAARMADVEQRLLQFRTASEISRAIGGVLDIKDLLNQVVTLVRDRFGLYYVGVFMIHETDEGKWATLSAATGKEGQRMISDGHRLRVGGDSMIGWAAAHGQSRIAQDAGQDTVRFKNPFLPLTRSEAALPILSPKRQSSAATVLGAITVQSDQPSFFDEDDITVLQSIADSLGIALENANLFADLQSSLEEIQALHRQYLAQSWSDEMNSRNRSDQLSYTYLAGGPEPDQDGSPLKSLQLPITLRDQTIGAVTLEAPGGAEAQWSPEEKALIDAVLAQAAQALENARLLDESQRRAAQESIRANIANKIWSSPDIDAILKITLSELGRSLRVSEGLIQLAVPGNEQSRN